MNARPEKILALQFKYFGDAVLMTPALRALREYAPAAALHVLVPEEIAPLVRHLPWLDRVWAMPRRRGHASLAETWPLLRALRRECFDRSVDFASNDRGAILSRLIGAKRRLGWDDRDGFFGRRFCYTERVAPAPVSQYEAERLVGLLAGWHIPPPASLALEIRADPALDGAARRILPWENAVVCHIAASMPRNEWPLAHWAEFHRLAVAAGRRVVFTTPLGAREAALIPKLCALAPAAEMLPAIPELPRFLAVLARARVFIAGDTGPMHIAAGLGVPTIALFGPSPSERWAPVGPPHLVLKAGGCQCDRGSTVCTAARHCLADLSPERVFAALGTISAGDSRRGHPVI